MSLPPMKPLSDQVSACGQLSAEHMKTLHAEGFASLICNRPDGEEPGQPTAASLRAAAEAAGLEFYFVPFAPASPSPTLAEDFSAAMAQATRPTIAFCRSGMRSERLFAVTQG